MRPSRAPLKDTPSTHPPSSVFHRCHSGWAQPPASSAGPPPPPGCPRPLPRLPGTGHDAPASVAVALPSPEGPPSLAPPLHPETGALGASRQQALVPRSVLRSFFPGSAGWFTERGGAAGAAAGAGGAGGGRYAGERCSQPPRRMIASRSRRLPPAPCWSQLQNLGSRGRPGVGRAHQG